ncbi:ribonuclease R [Thalassoroseus pseudoceratinae]|uniref:ribonuclease R n=1 Tax=Thalassoroseus pseudoceratinae TaxID=2713176 RepID=UPI00197DA69F|nr:ribonuclease R [Thalassoroseus pseudoceratinae]
MNEFEQQILDYLTQPDYKPIKASLLAKKLRVPKSKLSAFHDLLEQLIEDGQVRENRNGRIRPRALAGEVVGIIKRVGSGGGYVIPHERTPELQELDVYVAPEDVAAAHTGDEVTVRLSNRRRSNGQRCGRVTSIIQRATQTFVGTYFVDGEIGLVRVDGTTFTDPIFVGDSRAKSARPGDKVVIEMLRFPTPRYEGEGVITEVLGAFGEPGVDMQSIIHEFGLPQAFPEDALQEAREQAELFDEEVVGDRDDFTKNITVTIDPVDARDFDDAISLKRTRKGHWQLMVHIADVAHFVQKGSPLDREAYDRATSIYLPGRVIPMLPELISNGLASLQQGRIRYTKTVEIEYTPDGIPVDVQFHNSVIKVNKRFAYEEVMPIIRNPDKHKGRISAKVRQMLGWMHELAMTLRKRRFESGALELHLKEVKLDFNSDGAVSGAHTVEHDESHQIIEEFMLAANIAVATAMDDMEYPFLRRVHPEPDELKLKAFAEFSTALGFPIKKYQSRSHLQALIDDVHAKPGEQAVNFALLRSMKQASYSPEEVGHYALAEENYCHFTSPIRRYPDLTVHRLFDEIVKHNKKARFDNFSELAKQGRHCSDRERRAATAERELTKVKLLTYMESQVDETLEAVITGVERFGVFCQGVDVPAEGMIHVTALEPADYYDYEQSTFAFVGRRTGARFRLGDRIRVVVARVDVDRRELDFRVAPDNAPKTKKSKTKKKPKPKPKKTIRVKRKRRK